MTCSLTRLSWPAECDLGGGAACVNTVSMNSSAQVDLSRNNLFIFGTKESRRNGKTVCDATLPLLWLPSPCQPRARIYIPLRYRSKECQGDTATRPTTPVLRYPRASPVAVPIRDMRYQALGLCKKTVRSRETQIDVVEPHSAYRSYRVISHRMIRLQICSTWTGPHAIDRHR